MSSEQELVSIRKNRLFVWAIVITAINPIFAGLLLGIWMIREPDLKREGRIVTLFAVAWGVIALLLVAKFGTLKP